MKAFRCVGLLVIVLLSACDAQESPAPKPPATQSAAQSPAPQSQVSAETGSQASSAADQAAAQRPSQAAAPVTPESAPAKAVVHELAPNVPVVPVTAKTDSSASKPSVVPKATAAPPKSKADSKREAVSKKSVAESKKVLRDTSRSNLKLDLSLPPELAEELKPPANVITAKRKPLLPQMFGDKDGSSGQGPFELNGRLLNNEMQLQMRNDSRREVEGAALDFKFKQ